MNSEELIGDIGKIVVFLLVLLGIFLITTKSGRKLPNRLFAAFLWVTAIDFTGYFIGSFFENNPSVLYLKISSVLLQMPLFYLYVRSACYGNVKLTFRTVLHVIPFLIFASFFFISGRTDTCYFIYDVFSEIQYYGYIIAVFWTLHRYKTVFQQQHSNSKNSIYRWLFQTTVLFLTGNLLVKLRGLLASSENEELLLFINLAVSLFGLGVICWFVLKALYQPTLFSGIKEEVPAEKPTKNSEASERSLKELSAFMEAKKPYLDTELTLEKLAGEMKMTEKEVSLLINRGKGIHFFDYVNGYRIEEAKSLLSSNKGITVLEVLYQVGFNSKSSFYTAFKKVTGETPTSYRNKGAQ